MNNTSALEQAKTMALQGIPTSVNQTEKPAQSYVQKPIVVQKLFDPTKPSDSIVFDNKIGYSLQGIPLSGYVPGQPFDFQPYVDYIVQQYKSNPSFGPGMISAVPAIPKISNNGNAPLTSGKKLQPTYDFANATPNSSSPQEQSAFSQTQFPSTVGQNSWDQLTASGNYPTNNWGGNIGAMSGNPISSMISK